jgi:hypothetical protein
MEVHVFLTQNWTGNPEETKEISPEWFDIANPPYKLMWDDNQYWLPRVLKGEKIKGEFIMDEQEKVKDYSITVLE